MSGGRFCICKLFYFFVPNSPRIMAVEPERATELSALFAA